MENLFDVVCGHLTADRLCLNRDSIRLIKGDYQETLNIQGPVAFAHIDCDWYLSVKTCIERIHPHLALGRAFVFDDYRDFSGYRQAVDEFIAFTD